MPTPDPPAVLPFVPPAATPHLKVKVVEDEAAGRAFVVDERHGERLPDGSLYLPAALCMLAADGPARPFDRVRSDADRVAFLWNAGHEPTDAMKRAEFLVGTEALAALYFRDVLATCPFADVAEVKKFLAFRCKLISPAGHALWAAEMAAGVLERIVGLLNAWSNNARLTLKYAKERHRREAAADPRRPA